MQRKRALETVCGIVGGKIKRLAGRIHRHGPGSREVAVERHIAGRVQLQRTVRINAVTRIRCIIFCVTQDEVDVIDGKHGVAGQIDMLHAGNGVGTVQSVLCVLQPERVFTFSTIQAGEERGFRRLDVFQQEEIAAVTGGDIGCRTAGLQRDGVIATQ